MAQSLAFPLRLGTHGALVTNEQDSDADVENGIVFALTWPQGTRTLDPTYGRPAEADGGEPDPDSMAAAATHSEPRARARGTLLASGIATAIEQIGYERG